MRRIAALVVVVVLGACTGGSSTRAPVGAPTTTAQADAVRSLTQTFVDTTRPTAANRAAPAKPSRTLVTTIWYPPGSDRLPLVVWAHGFTATGPLYAVVTRPLAAAGYVVAAPTFPLSSGGAPGGPNLLDFQNQPADVSFVVTQLLRMDEDPSSPLHGRIDADRIAVGGHSLGAITTLGVTFDTCCRDARIKAAIVVSGTELPFRDGAFDAGAGTPVLFVHGDSDRLVPYAFGRAAFAHRGPPKFFLTMLGAGHVPTAPAQLADAVDAMRDFLDRYLKGEAAALDRLARDGNRPGVSRLDAVAG